MSASSATVDDEDVARRGARIRDIDLAERPYRLQPVADDVHQRRRRSFTDAVNLLEDARISGRPLHNRASVSRALAAIAACVTPTARVPMRRERDGSTSTQE